MRWIAAVLLLSGAAAAGEGEVEVARITAARLATLKRCTPADGQPRSETQARTCGFAALAELARFELRVQVAMSEVSDEQLAQKYPGGGVPAEERAQREAAWLEKIKRGQMTDAQRERARRLQDSADARIKRRLALRAQMRATRVTTLDARAVLDEDDAGETARLAVMAGTTVEQLKKELAQERAWATAEAKTQPPLSEAERAAVRAEAR